MRERERDRVVLLCRAECKRSKNKPIGKIINTFLLFKEFEFVFGKSGSFFFGRKKREEKKKKRKRAKLVIFT